MLKIWFSFRFRSGGRLFNSIYIVFGAHWLFFLYVYRILFGIVLNQENFNMLGVPCVKRWYSMIRLV